MKKIIILIILFSSPFAALALLFDGSNDYVAVPDSSSVDIASDFSISMWLKTTSTANTVILEKSNNNTNYQMHMSSVTGGDLQFGICSSGTTCRVESNFKVSDGNWHHAVGTFSDGNNTLRIYIDGVLRNSNTNATDGLAANTQSLLIGSRSGSFGFPGLLNDVRIYKRELSVNEVRQLYRGGIPSPAGLVGYWPLIGNSGGVFEPDFSGKGNHGTRTNSPIRAARPPFFALFRFGRI